jgi:hypothetical protein
MKMEKLKRQIVELPGFIQTMIRYIEIYNDVEEILYFLPVSNKIRKKLETFTVIINNIKISFPDLFDQSNIKTLNYNLMVME